MPRGLPGHLRVLERRDRLAFAAGNYNTALKAADDLSQIFGKGNFYIELMDHGLSEQKTVNEGLLKIAKELNLPLW